VAVAWVLDQEARPPRTVPAIAARLQDLYFDREQHRGEPVQASFEEDLLSALDAPQLALDLRRHLGADLCRITSLRARGADLKAIAEDQQVSISTAHQRVSTAVCRIRELVRRRDLSPGSPGRLLFLLGSLEH
jgi:hypothetical protein